MNSELITQKIDELIELSAIEGEFNVQSVMLALAGARLMGDDALLANKVMEFIDELLMPKVEQAIVNNSANKN